YHDIKGQSIKSAVNAARSAMRPATVPCCLVVLADDLANPVKRIRPKCPNDCRSCPRRKLSDKWIHRTGDDIVNGGDEHCHKDKNERNGNAPPRFSAKRL